MSLRDQLSPVGRNRYDIELSRMIKKHGEEEGLRRTERMAARWLGKA